MWQGDASNDTDTRVAKKPRQCRSPPSKIQNPELKSKCKEPNLQDECREIINEVKDLSMYDHHPENTPRVVTGDLGVTCSNDQYEVPKHLVQDSETSGIQH